MDIGKGFNFICTVYICLTFQEYQWAAFHDAVFDDPDFLKVILTMIILNHFNIAFLKPCF